MEHDDEIQIDPVNYLRVIFCKEFQVSRKFLFYRKFKT